MIIPKECQECLKKYKEIFKQEREDEILEILKERLSEATYTALKKVIEQTQTQKSPRGLASDEASEVEK